MEKGKLKIFFGYSAGVGKTYAMLKAAQEAKQEGVDVVVGYLEPHDRPETLKMAEGKYPILGICYGAQFMSYTNGGKVEPAGTREYGRAHLTSFCKDNVLFLSLIHI